MAKLIFTRFGFAFVGIFIATAGRGLADSASLPSPDSFGFFRGGETNEEKQDVRQIAQAMFDLMRDADSVSIFKIDASGKSNEKERHSIIGAEREELVAIFLDPASYYHGLYCVGEPPSDIGIEFRKENQKLVIEFGFSLFKGEFNGKKLHGRLETRAYNRVAQWRQKYWLLK